MASINVRQPNPGGLTLGWSAERLANPGSYYNFAGAHAGTFTAGPLNSNQVRALPANADPAFAGRNDDDMTGLDPAVFPAGEYLITAHDLDAGDLARVGESATTLGGSGAGGSLTASDVAAAVWARLIDGTSAAGVMSLVGSALADWAKDGQGLITFKALDRSAVRLTYTDAADGSGRTVTINPGT